MKTMRKSMIAMAAAWALTGALPALAGDGSVRVVPVDGAHWKAGAGLPDPNRSSNIGLVQDVIAAGHTEVAILHHLEGAPGSALNGLAFASQTPNGIDPCWKIGITTVDGSVRVLHLTLDSARNEGQLPPPTGDFAPFTRWSWSFTLPADATINWVSLQVDAGQQPPPVGDRVAFDGFAVNGAALSTP